MNATEQSLGEDPKARLERPLSVYGDSESAIARIRAKKIWKKLLTFSNSIN
jgi:hypothetical protein